MESGIRVIAERECCRHHERFLWEPLFFLIRDTSPVRGPGTRRMPCEARRGAQGIGKTGKGVQTEPGPENRFRFLLGKMHFAAQVRRDLCEEQGAVPRLPSGKVRKGVNILFGLIQKSIVCRFLPKIQSIRHGMQKCTEHGPGGNRNGPIRLCIDAESAALKNNSFILLC